MKDQNSLSTEQQAFKRLIEQFRAGAVAYAGLRGGTIPEIEAGILIRQILDFVEPGTRWSTVSIACLEYAPSVPD